jgi:pseudouridine synthase
MTSPGATRLHKAIADAGLASRRKAEKLIAEGRVRVNGEIVREMGVRVVPGKDRVEVEGAPLPAKPKREVWALYKPRNCVTTLSDPEDRATIADFFPRTRSRLFPVGRLDYDAEGLILLTNDGEFAQRIGHPSHAVPKTYLVKVNAVVDPVALAHAASEPWIDGVRRRPMSARVLHNVNGKSWCELVLREGLHHEIKKFFEALGHRVVRLKRFQIGSLMLDAMRPGESRRLNPEELAELLGESHPARPARHPRGSARNSGARARPA